MTGGGSGAACAICRAGTVLLASVRPAQHESVLRGSGDSNGPVSTLLSLTPDLTCGRLQSVASDRWDENDASCDAWRVALSGACCESEGERGDNVEGGASSPRRRAQEQTSMASAMAEAASTEFEVNPEGTSRTAATANASAVPLYECEQAVQSYLFGDDSDYSTTAAPVRSASSPMNVSTSISFYHATELSTLAGTGELFFGFILHWHDERLAWNPSEFGGCDTFSARASIDAEKTEIWVPDFDLLNRISGVQALPDAMADVSSTGDVEWYRLGGVKAICMFDGLERFPYDELECDFLFGSPESSMYNLVNYVLNEDVLFPEGRRIAKYQEYTVMPERTKVTYDEEGYVRIRFTFERASRFYTSTIVIPTIIFTFVSFGMFLLDIRVGERLAFGVSLLLVIVANSILTADMLPICEEQLWVKVLTTASYYWVITALLESIAVAYLYFLETEDMEAKKKKAEGDESGSARTKGKEEKEMEMVNRTGSGISLGGANGVNTVADGGVVLPLARKSSTEHSFREGSPPSEGKGLNEEEGGEGEESKGCRSAFRKRMTWQGSFRGTLWNILFASPHPSETWRMTAIDRMDRFCAVVFPVSYIIFFSVMIARNKYW